MINLDYLNDLGGGDQAFIIEMLNTYLEETTSDLNDLEAVFVDENMERIGFLTHRLKSAFRILGLEDLTMLAQSIELSSKKENISVKSLAIPLKSLLVDARQSCVEAKMLVDKLSN